MFPRAREEGSLFAAGDRMPVEIQMKFTASDREQEQRLAYFREDIGVNMYVFKYVHISIDLNCFIKLILFLVVF